MEWSAARRNCWRRPHGVDINAEKRVTFCKRITVGALHRHGLWPCLCSRIIPYFGGGAREDRAQVETPHIAKWRDAGPWSITAREMLCRRSDSSSEPEASGPLS